jgi:hypothetical protein
MPTIPSADLTEARFYVLERSVQELEALVNYLYIALEKTDKLAEVRAGVDRMRDMRKSLDAQEKRNIPK